MMRLAKILKRKIRGAFYRMIKLDPKYLASSTTSIRKTL
jgi:hypothetical protein